MDRRKAEARLLSPVVSVGKNRITDRLVAQVAMELGSKHLIKIKMLKSAATDRTQRAKLAAELATRTQSEIVDQVGGMVVLYR